MTARLMFLVLFACSGPPAVPAERDTGAAKSRHAPPADRPHTILTSALTPWTSIAAPVLEDSHSSGDRITSRHDVFNVGGFRLTFVPAKDPSEPEAIGRVEYVFRASSLPEVSDRLVQALDRFGFAVPRQLDDVIARAAQMPDDLAGLDLGDRMVSQAFDWAPAWRGFVKIFAEGALTGTDTHRAQWMVELRAFQPDFRAASDP